jgi:hypothetical protein
MNNLFQANPEMNTFARSYVPEINECQDMEVKILYLLRLIIAWELPMQDFDTNRKLPGLKDLTNEKVSKFT